MSTTSHYASISKRFVAVLIDGIFLQILFFVAFGKASTTLNNPKSIIYNIFITLVGWIYFAAMESSSLQATFGKKVVGICVTDTSGNKISFARATTRYFGKSLFILIWIVAGIIAFMAQSTAGQQSPYLAVAGLLFLIGIIVPILGYVMAFFTQEKQALHDIIARCLVVDGSSESRKIPWKMLIGLAIAAIVTGRVLSQVPDGNSAVNIGSSPSPSITASPSISLSESTATPTPTPTLSTQTSDTQTSAATRTGITSIPTRGTFTICGSSQQLIEPGNGNINGDWRLEFSGANGTTHIARLQMQGASGKMRVAFPDVNGTQGIVDQTMQLYTSSQGLFLLGFNPVDANTGAARTSYNADNLLIRRELNGSVTVINCDEAGNRSPVSVKRWS